MATNKITTIEEAIKVIVSYQTLPSQIDYRVPYKIKSDAAEKFIETLDENKKKEVYSKIEEEVDAHYSPCHTDAEGVEYSAAELTEMF